MPEPAEAWNAAGETITLTRICDARPERVFRSWTDPEELKRWYTPDINWTIARVQVDLRVGGVFRVEFGPAGAPPFVEQNEFLEVEPPHRLVWWERVSRDAETIHGPGRCTITFRDLGHGRTEVTVTDTLDQGERPEARTVGWSTTLDGLVALWAESAPDAKSRQKTNVRQHEAFPCTGWSHTPV